MLALILTSVISVWSSLQAAAAAAMAFPLARDTVYEGTGLNKETSPGPCCWVLLRVLVLVMGHGVFFGVVGFVAPYGFWRLWILREKFIGHGTAMLQGSVFTCLPRTLKILSQAMCASHF